MNKIFTSTLLLLGLATTALAQSVQFYYQGQPLDDGATVTIKAEKDIWGDLVCETNPVDNGNNGLILKNLTASDISGTASLTISTRSMLPAAVTWCMGGDCVPIAGDTYQKSFSVKGGSSIQTQFDAQPTQYGELTAQIKVEASLKTTTVNIVFQNPDPDAKLTFVRRTVIEEYTGTWCGNCPRGFVGVNKLVEKYGDRCIAIAVHVGSEVAEPMKLDAYREVMPGDGVPCCTIDRGGKLDPYSGSGKNGAHHFGADIDFEEALAVPTEAGLELTAEWDDEQTDVYFTASTTFNIDSPDAPYRLAFILLEDGLKGEGKLWSQVNYFAPTSSTPERNEYLDEDMSWWRNQPYYVEGMEYNHVPVNTSGIQNGIAGSIKAPIVYGETQSYTGIVTTYKKTVIQDKSRLSAVALLLNTETGRIVNAATAPIRQSGVSAIALPSAETSVDGSAVYDLQGRRLLSAAAKGLYIRNGRKYFAQ